MTIEELVTRQWLNPKIYALFKKAINKKYKADLTDLLNNHEWDTKNNNRPHPEFKHWLHSGELGVEESFVDPTDLI